MKESNRDCVAAPVVRRAIPVLTFALISGLFLIDAHAQTSSLPASTATATTRPSRYTVEVVAEPNSRIASVLGFGALSESGQVVGSLRYVAKNRGADVDCGFTWSDGKLTELTGTPLAISTHAFGIDGRGVILGTDSGSDRALCPAVWIENIAKRIEIPANVLPENSPGLGQPQTINSRGFAFGEYGVAVLRDNVAVAIAEYPARLPEGKEKVNLIWEVPSCNDKGYAAGTVTIPSTGKRPVAFRVASVDDGLDVAAALLPLPPNCSGGALAINRAGTMIVGWSDDKTKNPATTRACRWVLKDRAWDFSLLAIDHDANEQSEGTAVNDRGLIGVTVKGAKGNARIAVLVIGDKAVTLGELTTGMMQVGIVKGINEKNEVLVFGPKIENKNWGMYLLRPRR